MKSHCFVLHKIDDKTSVVLHMEGMSESIIRPIYVIAYKFTGTTDTYFADNLMLLHYLSLSGDQCT